MTRIVQVVPRLPPAVDGLGDYATLLGEGLARLGVDSSYLVGDPLWRGAATSPTPHRILVERTSQALLAALGGDTHVLLHFVNYAYEPTHGCPWWLLDGLTRWRGAAPGRRLVVMFHELFAMGWPWRKAFWYSPAQRALSAGLARLADRLWTSNGRYADWLSAVRREPVASLPVPSNVGEPVTIGSWSQREPVLVVFGRAVNRARAYRELGHDLIALARHHGITRLHDVGAPLPTAPRLTGLDTTVHGLLPASALSELLLRCQVGVIHNEGSPLAKSGVIAAYAAHGLAMVCEANAGLSDGLVARHNLLPLAGDLSPSFSTLAAAAQAWYARHDSSHLAQHVSDSFAFHR